MSDKPRRRGRPAIYDPELIAKLLAERDTSGETYKSLAARSGIPAATLARYAGLVRPAKPVAAPAFVEIVPSPPAAWPQHGATSIGSTSLRVILRGGGAAREVVVPPGFDPSELHRVIAVLESPC